MTSLDKSVGMNINYINRKILRFLSLNLKKYNITTEQWSVLFYLLEQDGINQKQLAIKVHKDQATLVRILDILERKNLILRKKCAEDRRSFLIYGTPEGKELKEEVYPFVESLFMKLINNISKEQLDSFIDTLKTIEENIDIQEQKLNSNS